MTTAATASATSYTGTISMQMGRSSRRTGPTLIRLRGTPVGLQLASLMTLGPVDRSKFSKSTASRLTKDYKQTVYVVSWHKAARRRGDRINAVCRSAWVSDWYSTPFRTSVTSVLCDLGN